MDEKLLVKNIDSNKSSKLDEIKKEMTSKEKIDFMVEGAMAVGSFKFSDNGFKVNKGEKGIKILIPTKITYLLLGDKEKQLKYASKEEKVKKGLIKTIEKIFYKTGYVFDVSQTNAKSSDLPKLFPNKWLDGDVKGYRNMIIHCYAYWKGIYVRDIDELENEVIELNNSFIDPMK